MSLIEAARKSLSPSTGQLSTNDQVDETYAYDEVVQYVKTEER